MSIFKYLEGMLLSQMREIWQFGKADIVKLYQDVTSHQPRGKGLGPSKAPLPLSVEDGVVIQQEKTNCAIIQSQDTFGKITLSPISKIDLVHANDLTIAIHERHGGY